MNDNTLSSEEEKSYDEWVAKNLAYIHDHKQSISVMKTLFIEGFRAGVLYRDQIDAEQHLQK